MLYLYFNFNKKIFKKIEELKLMEIQNYIIRRL